MAIAVVSRTWGAVVQDCARLTGDIRNQGTFTAGTTTTGTDSNNERTPTAQDNAIVGDYLYFPSGTSAGTAREITTYGTIGVYTWIQAATAPDTTTTWIRLRRRPQVLLDAIDSVTRMAAFKQAVPYESRAIITNNLLGYQGTMEEFTSGTAVAPDGWTLAGAGSSVAREATTIGQGLYSTAVTAGAGAVATLTRTVPYSALRDLDGAALTLHGLVGENVAADGVIRVIVTSGTGTVTNTDRTGTYTGNRFEELKDISAATISLTDPAVGLQLQCRVALSAVVYFDDQALLSPKPIFNYELPPTLIGLEQTIYMESARNNGKFEVPLKYGENWSVIWQDGQGTTRSGVLLMHQALPSGRHLLVKGYRAPDLVTAATSNVEPNPEWLALAAAVHILESEPDNGNATRLQTLRQRLSFLEATAVGDVRKSRGIIWAESR